MVTTVADTLFAVFYPQLIGGGELGLEDSSQLGQCEASQF
jgi:hypothetical protein